MASWACWFTLFKTFLAGEGWSYFFPLLTSSVSLQTQLEVDICVSNNVFCISRLCLCETSFFQNLSPFVSNYMQGWALHWHKGVCKTESSCVDVSSKTHTSLFEPPTPESWRWHMFNTIPSLCCSLWTIHVTKLALVWQQFSQADGKNKWFSNRWLCLSRMSWCAASISNSYEVFGQGRNPFPDCWSCCCKTRKT